MKTTLKLSFVAVFLYLLLGAFSCETPYGGHYREYYIDVYKVADTLMASKSSINSDGKPTWSLYADGEISYWQNSSKHKELRERYGDTHFNRKAAPVEVALALPLLSVNVVALDNYSEEYPAGSSLNDITSLKFRTCYPFVSSGYKSPYGFTEMKKKLSDIQPKDWYMLKDWFDIFLDQAPAIHGEHKVQVTFTFEDGKQITQTLILSANQGNK
ncbi:hypothetical protein [Porphyromonas loveana]|uniref:Uncharacterized protein n=1 Tax=Porphyromonas loveana TaxID=1884669 RepID=A0A2U1FCH7_9PORP|nr:hypothetical protein [Porphyromonas loveana]PVZ09882.1 hypothetical protein C7382_10871 [Porphyromonas loveana]